MKILYVDPVNNIKSDPCLEYFKNTEFEALSYSPSDDPIDKTRWEMRHFQMYEKMLDIAEELKVDVIYLGTLSMPEYLLFELKIRPNFKPKIIFATFYRGYNRTLARAQVLKELSDLPQIGLIVINTMTPETTSIPTTLERVGFDARKVFYVGYTMDVTKDINIPSFFVEKEEARKFFGIGKDEFVIMTAGGWSFTKGVDLFIEAISFLPENIKVLLHRNKDSFDSNLDSNLFGLVKEKHDNTLLIEETLGKKEYPYLFRAADLVVCSYRRSCEYTPNSIFPNAAEARRLIISPDFYYPNYLVDKYKIGVKYEPENPKAMAEAIIYAKENYDKLIKEADFVSPFKNMIAQSSIVFESIKYFVRSC